MTPSRRRALALTSVILANVMAVIDYNIVSVAIPRLLCAFPGSTLAGLSWTITGYTVVFAAVLLPAGGMADRLGPKRIFLTGLAVFTAGSAACALAPGPAGLVLARMLQATGGGAVVALAISVGLSEFPGRAGHAFGLLGKRWNGVILGTLMEGSASFSEVRRALNGISDSVLSERLSELATAGLVTRTVDAGPPISVAYTLTESGRGLMPALTEITSWARINFKPDQEQQ